MEKDTIRLVILSSGEHLVGFTEETEAGVKMRNPVVMIPDPSNPQRMGFMPYLQFSDQDECYFTTKDIRHILKANPAITDGYDRQYGSGLQVPSNQIILG